MALSCLGSPLPKGVAGVLRSPYGDTGGGRNLAAAKTLLGFTRVGAAKQPADYRHQAPWSGITFAELRDEFPSWCQNNSQSQPTLCRAYICPVKKCPVLGYRTRKSWSAHVQSDKEADHSELRKGRLQPGKYYKTLTHEGDAPSARDDDGITFFEVTLKPGTTAAEAAFSEANRDVTDLEATAETGEAAADEGERSMMSSHDKNVADRTYFKKLLAKELEDRCMHLNSLEKEHSTIRRKLARATVEDLGRDDERVVDAISKEKEAIEDFEDEQRARLAQFDSFAFPEGYVRPIATPDSAHASHCTP
eukprot:jgi/Astpho2/5838/Aster-02349